MAQPNIPPAAAPAPAAKAGTPDPKAVVDPKAAAAPAAEGADKGPVEAKKPANQLEADLAAQFGEEWDSLPPKAKERVIAAEMKAREADKRMQLAAKLKKDLDMTNGQVAQLIEGLKRDPWKVLSNPALGHDVRKLAEGYVWDMIQEQRMTPEQREAARNKAELAAIKSAQEREEQERIQQKQLQDRQERRQWFERNFVEAVKRHNMPNDPQIFGQMAYNTKLFRINNPQSEIDFDWVATKTKQDFLRWQNSWLASAPEEHFENLVDKEFVKRLRKWDLGKLRAKGLAPRPGPKSSSGQPAQAGPKKMSMSEWLNNRDQRLGRK